MYLWCKMWSSKIPHILQISSIQTLCVCEREREKGTVRYSIERERERERKVFAVSEFWFRTGLTKEWLFVLFCLVLFCLLWILCDFLILVTQTQYTTLQWYRSGIQPTLINSSLDSVFTSVLLMSVSPRGSSGLGGAYVLTSCSSPASETTELI